MKVFLNDRLIILCKKTPSEGEYIHIGSQEQLHMLYYRFEKDPSQKVLTLVSDYYVNLKRDFLKLFDLVHAAGGLVKNENGEILFIFRRGRWDLPKGKIGMKKGWLTEKKSLAAIREVQEETGLQEVYISHKIGKSWHIFYDKGARMLKKTTWYEMRADSSQRLVPQAEEEILEVKWIGAGELEGVIDGTYPSLRPLFYR